MITAFKATSDLPQWMDAFDKKELREFLEANRTVRKKSRYQYQINGRKMDFSPAIPIRSSDKNIPVVFAKYLGLAQIVWEQPLSAILMSLKK